MTDHPHHEQLWHFALKIYPPLERELLALQDQFKLDVCCLLAALWAGRQGGHRIDEPDWRRLLETTVRLRADIAGIRSMRRSMAVNAGQSDMLQNLYYCLKDAELAGERVLLQKLHVGMGESPDAACGAELAGDNVFNYLLSTDDMNAQMGAEPGLRELLNKAAQLPV